MVLFNSCQMSRDKVGMHPVGFAIAAPMAGGRAMAVSGKSGCSGDEQAGGSHTSPIPRASALLCSLLEGPVHSTLGPLLSFRSLQECHPLRGTLGSYSETAVSFADGDRDPGLLCSAHQYLTQYRTPDMGGRLCTARSPGPRTQASSLTAEQRTKA